MRLVVLTDNHTYIDQYFLGEPGLSFYIEVDDRKILFDTGYSDVFLRNAQKMNLELNQITDLVLSHGHNDHTGGLKDLLQLPGIQGTRLIAHEDVFCQKKIQNENIGASLSFAEVVKELDFVGTKIPYQISEHCYFLGEIPQTQPFESRQEMGQIYRQEQWSQDMVYDDSGIVMVEPEGLWIITGCAHSGICNTIERAMEITQESRILGVLGGFHLFQPGKQVEQTIEYLAKHQVKDLYPCHCVSLKVKAEFMKTLKVHEVAVGMEIKS